MKEPNRAGRPFIELPLTDYCRQVARPELPSPTGGAVTGVTGALLASLAELTLRVTQNHWPISENREERDEWSGRIESLRQFSEMLLAYSEEDVYEAERMVRGYRQACVRKQLAAPAKIASRLAKLLRLVEQVADRMHPSVRADVRLLAHLGRGTADGIYEIERENILWHGGGDDRLLKRIDQWREDAHQAADGILKKTESLDVPSAKDGQLRGK
jgi:formiminotetrahydrofolate cyclodeaminase